MTKETYKKEDLILGLMLLEGSRDHNHHDGAWQQAGRHSAEQQLRTQMLKQETQGKERELTGNGMSF